MTVRWERAVFASLFIALLAGWGVQHHRLRQIDGRDAAQWFEFAQLAARTAAYQAEGLSWTRRGQSRFQLDQAASGCFTVRVDGQRGAKPVTMGFDGAHTWFDNGGEVLQAETASAGQEPAAKPKAMRLVGTGRQAGRPVVRLAVASGPTRKLLAVDRETGVVLTMATSFRGTGVSRMRLDSITYGERAFSCRAPSSTVHSRRASAAEAAHIAGGKLLQPRWLPPGFQLAGTFAGNCGCCRTDMVLRQYSDGVNSFTLFQSREYMSCAKAGGCYMAPSNSAVVDTREINGSTVTIVGTVTPAQAERIMANLRE